jgi:outer membrane protein assembly factor BamB
MKTDEDGPVRIASKTMWIVEILVMRMATRKMFENWLGVLPVPLVIVILGMLATHSSRLRAEDWPMWRYDSGRTAASPQELPPQMNLLWMRREAPRQQAWDDPLNFDLMTYDRVFEPIVMGGKVFVGFNDRDKLAAYDAATGQEIWSFFTDAPIRLAPVGWRGRVYVASDDGKLYCVNAESGRLEWQFRGGPSDRRVIGNKRLISAWPARGGPVIHEDQLYFAASIWPFMGVFIYSLDPDTGDVVWVNDSTGSQYIKQPHSAPSFAGVGPQGSLVATKEHLLVPGGRSVPAVFDRLTGEFRYFELNAGGKGTGGSFVIANDHSFFVHTRLKGVREFQLASGDKTAFMPNEPVLHGDLVYSAEESEEQPLIRCYGADRQVQWEIAADGRGDLILAGSALYAAGPTGLSAIRLPASGSEKPHVFWTAQTPGQVERLLAADGKLFAVTLEGAIAAYGAGDTPAEPLVTDDPEPLQSTPETKEIVQRLLQAGDAQGYALWFDATDEALATAMAEASPFEQLAVVDEDRDRVERLRSDWDQAGHYGKVTAHATTPQSFSAPPYLAHMIFLGKSLSERASHDPQLTSTLYESVRPYGGVLYFLASPEDRRGIAAQLASFGLEQAEVESLDEGVVIRRVGELPGSADWTHLHGDIANRRKSDDRRVQLPLGLLWFGGSSNMDVLPRHGHGPPQQVVGGRLFIQGINSLSARDVYTGRVLWKHEFQDLGTYDVYYDETYKDTPLDPAYNQVHIPGANARGTNYVVTEDRVYIVEGSVCHVLDPVTGELLQDIEMPRENSAQPQEWGFLGVYGDVLLGGIGFARYRERLGLSFVEEDGELKANRAGFGSKSLDRAGSAALVGFDRHTGQQLWKVDARHSFWHNAIVAGAGKVYCLDKNPQPVEDKLRRRGVALPDSYRIVALDAKSGEVQWQVEEGIFGTWLGYSEKHDLLLQAGAAASDRLSVEVGQGMAVYRGIDGQVHWRKDDLNYSGPCILHNDLIITNTNSYRESAGAFYLTSGEPYLIRNPLTGEEQPWKITRAYGCNTILASENLLTFRSGAAGFYDLVNHSGTGNLGGFKSGCTSNLIAANGVLNAPDYTRTCSCAYQNQTSLALVHMPEIETWTVSHMAKLEGRAGRIEKLGLNFGAPGHRRDRDGILWIESPTIVDETSPVKIMTAGNPSYFARHSSSFAHATSDYAWVLASGLEGEVEIRVGMTVTSNDDKDPPDVETEAYQVRLFFGVPSNGPESGNRTFDVVLQGETVLSDVTLSQGEVVIREIPEVAIGQELSIRLVKKTGEPLLSGIELKKIETGSGS